MSTNPPVIEALQEAAKALGLQAAIASQRAAIAYQANENTVESERLQEEFLACNEAYHHALRDLETALGEDYPTRRREIVQQVRQALKTVPGLRLWRCKVCDWAYDEKEGVPEGGVAPGTPIEELPEDWSCPDCGVDRDQFELVLE